MGGEIVLLYLRPPKHLEQRQFSLALYCHA